MKIISVLILLALQTITISFTQEIWQNMNDCISGAPTLMYKISPALPTCSLDNSVYHAYNCTGHLFNQYVCSVNCTACTRQNGFDSNCNIGRMGTILKLSCDIFKMPLSSIAVQQYEEGSCRYPLQDYDYRVTNACFNGYNKYTCTSAGVKNTTYQGIGCTGAILSQNNLNFNSSCSEILPGVFVSFTQCNTLNPTTSSTINISSRLALEIFFSILISINFLFN